MEYSCIYTILCTLKEEEKGTWGILHTALALSFNTIAMQDEDLWCITECQS